MFVDDNKKTYPANWVVMQNNIQECFKSMNIDEKRLLILASPIARTSHAKEKDTILIKAEDFAKECGIKTHSAYTQLEIASRNLIKRNFSYHNERGKRVLSNWVIDCTYEEGGIAIRFPEIVLLMLTEFDKLNPYTKYNTDIDLTYENVKQGRSVVGFKFTVREKPKPKLVAPQRDTSTVDLFCNMSDAQINKYSNILSKLSELSDLSNFPDYPTFALWISGILRDSKSVREETAIRIFKALYAKTDFKP